MGNSLSKQNLQLKELMARFDELQRIPERNITYLQDKETHKEFVLKESTFNDQKEFNRNVEKLLAKKAAMEGQPHVAQLSEYLVRTEDQYCSTFYKIYALFEYPYKTLEDEIHERQLQHRRFLEKELWSILASCILGLSHLQRFQVRHQALKSSSILLTNDGLIKVSDPYCTSQPSNYEVLLTKRNTPHIYLSPELCESLSQELTSPQLLNPYRSDVFTVAMIMLEAGLLQYQDECYRDECARLHWDTLQYNLDRFGESYSHELKSTLESMLQQTQEDRPEWIDLEAHVKVGGEEDVDNTRVQTPMSRQRQITRQSHPVRGGSNVGSVPPKNIGQSAVSNVSGAAGAHSQVEASPYSVATTVVQVPSQHTSQTQRVVYNPPPPPSQRTSVQPVPQYVVQSQPPPVTSNFHQTIQSQAPISSQSIQPQQTQNIQSQPLVNPIPTIRRTQGAVPVAPIDEINPVEPSYINTVRPAFQSVRLPNPTYVTNVKNDENLVEVYEEDEPSSSFRINDPKQSVRDSEVKSPTAIASGKIVQPAPATIGKAGGMTVSMSKVTPSSIVNSALNSHQISAQSPHQAPYSAVSSLPTTISNQFYAPQSWQPTANLTSTNPVGQNFYRPLNSLPGSNLTSPSVVGANPSLQRPSSYLSSGIPQYSSIPPSNTNYSSALTTGNGYSIGTQFYQSPTFSYTPSATTQQQFSNTSHYQPPADASLNLAKTASFGVQITTPNTFSRTAKPSDEPSKSHRTYVVEIFKQGSKYEGDKLNDMRDGHGKFYYQDGGLYDGEWRQNKMSGHGKLFYQSGKIAYDGEWSNDQFTGFGILYNEEPVVLQRPFDFSNLDDIDEYWTKFEGEFFDDLKHGNGKLYLSNGEWFEGLFDRDVASGPGKFHTMRGQLIAGIWNNNTLQRRTN